VYCKVVVRNIPLKLDTKLDFINGITFTVGKKSQSLVIFLNGEYENKIAVSSVSKTNWKKTQDALKKALESKVVSKEHINLVLDNLDNNSDTICRRRLVAVGLLPELASVRIAKVRSFSLSFNILYSSKPSITFFPVMRWTGSKQKQQASFHLYPLL
jgi:hypothetical protein